MAKISNNSPITDVVYYEVKASDTIEKIALRYNISPSELVKMNKLLSRLIYPGQKMIVPSADLDNPKADDFNPDAEASKQSRGISSKEPSSKTLPGPNPHEPNCAPIFDANKNGVTIIPATRSLSLDPKASDKTKDKSHLRPQRSAILAESDENTSEENDPNVQNFVKCPAIYFRVGSLSPLKSEPRSCVLNGIILTTPSVLMFDFDGPGSRATTTDHDKTKRGPGSKNGQPALTFSFTIGVADMVSVSLFTDATLEYTHGPADLDFGGRGSGAVRRIRSIIPCGHAIDSTLSPSYPDSQSQQPPTNNNRDTSSPFNQSDSWEIGLASVIGQSLFVHQPSSRVSKHVERSQTITSNSPQFIPLQGSKSLTSVSSKDSHSPQKGAIVFVRINCNPCSELNEGLKNISGKSVVNSAEGNVNSSKELDADDINAPHTHDFWFGVPREGAQKLFRFLDQCFRHRKNKSQEKTSQGQAEEIQIQPLNHNLLDDYPSMLGSSEILDLPQIAELSSHLPPRAIGYYWILVYSTSQNGFSLSTFYRKMKLCDVDSPVLLVVRDKTSQIFGALTSCPVMPNEHFYGTGETFLYTFHPSFKFYKWTGENNFFMKSDSEGIVVGSGNGLYGLWLDADFYHGRTHKCATFDNDPLTINEDFIIDNLEAWYFGDPPPPSTAIK